MSDGDREAVRVHVSGRVQGVFFRQSTCDRAREAGASGWVKNLPDGRVAAFVQGPREAVSAVLDWIRRGGPSAARVDDVSVEPADPDAALSDFEVR